MAQFFNLSSTADTVGGSRFYKTISRVAYQWWWSNPFAVTLWLATLGVFVGVALILPVQSVSPPFNLLGRTIPTHLWGLFQVSISVFSFCAPFLSRKKYINMSNFWVGKSGERKVFASFGLRGISAMFSFLVWAFQFWVTYLADLHTNTWHTTALATFAGIAVMWAWVFLRTPSDKKGDGCDSSYIYRDCPNSGVGNNSCLPQA